MDRDSRWCCISRLDMTNVINLWPTIRECHLTSCHYHPVPQNSWDSRDSLEVVHTLASMFGNLCLACLNHFESMSMLPHSWCLSSIFLDVFNSELDRAWSLEISMPIPSSKPLYTPCVPIMLICLDTWHQAGSNYLQQLQQLLGVFRFAVSPFLQGWWL